MPRGPFQGTWRQGIRPTVAHAPDALVYINGEMDILGCPRCRRRFDLNKYVTSVQVDLNIDSPPGSASINLSLPRHTIDDFYFEGTPLITPMMEVEIYMKGFFLLEGVPQYYPTFWGLVTEVEDSYSAGEHTVSINCADILKWWELCRMNINPAWTSAVPNIGGRNLFGNVFYGMNPYDVIWSLAQQSFGDVVVGSGSLVSVYKEKAQKQTFNTALADIMLYWTERFSRIRNRLLLYGTQGVAVRGDTLFMRYQKRGAQSGKPFASAVVRTANGGNKGSQMVFDPTDENVVAFRTQFMNAGQVNFWQSEYQTKLEIAMAAKEAIGFEFYMDVDGSIVFKPPFYNLDVLGNKPVSWIQDIDIIDWSLSDSDSEVVTQVQIQGSFGGNIDYGMSEETTPFTSVTDYHLLRKYGWRPQTFNSEFMGSPQLMFYAGLDLMDRYNARRFGGTINIPCRPELRLGFPVYVAPKDQIWYIQGLSHNVQMGGRAQTTLTLTAKREKFIAPRGIGSVRLTGYSTGKGKVTEIPQNPADDIDRKVKSLTTQQLAKGGQFELKVGEAAELPPINRDNPNSDAYAPLILRHPKTGRIMGYPNVVMAYTRPFSNVTDNQFLRAAGQKQLGTTNNATGKKLDRQLNAALADTVDTFKGIVEVNDRDRLLEIHSTNRYAYGLNSAGVYTYAHDVSEVIKEILMIARSKITSTDVAGNEGNFLTSDKGTAMIRPVSDERGFEIVGHYKYGRGIALRDGSLVLADDPGRPNMKANVDFQAAIGGDLQEILEAQSQGLTTLSTTYPNPADAIARMAPEELQTAATIEPDTGKPVFTEVQKNFVDAAPLGSLANDGVPVSVEAGQLSKALTLAEMKAREDEALPNEDCECLTGRADLAFINVGYQLASPVGTSAPDTGQIPGDGRSEFGTPDLLVDGGGNQVDILGDFTAQSEAIRAEEREAILNDPRVTLGEITENDAQRIADSRASERIAVLAGEQGVSIANQQVAMAASEGRPIQSIGALGQQQLSRVDDFLLDLYRTLDDAHRQYESAIRGETLDVPGRDPRIVRFGDPTDVPGDLSPPFNKARRLGGDLDEIVSQATTAQDNLRSNWENFGETLKEETNTSLYSARIESNQRKLQQLQEERDRLKTAKATGSTIITAKSDRGPSSQLERVEAQISRVEQDIARNQQKLNQARSR